jgi:hypothetical protein
MRWTRHVTTSLCGLSPAPLSTELLFRFNHPRIVVSSPITSWNQCHVRIVRPVPLPSGPSRTTGNVEAWLRTTDAPIAWHGTTLRFMRHTLEKAGRSSVFEFKSYGGWRGTIGRVCCRTRSGVVIGWRRRTGASKITQPGAYTGKHPTMPRSTAHVIPNANSASKHPVPTTLPLANQNSRRAVAMSWPS